MVPPEPVTSAIELAASTKRITHSPLLPKAYIRAKLAAMILAEPVTYETSQTGALPAAVDWVQGVLLGSAGTAIAVLAVAGVGAALLQGRLAPRDGLRVVLGCFILFGAPAITQGLMRLAQDTSSTAVAVPVTVPLMPPPPQLPSPRSNPFDPYAGAAVPQ